MGHLPIHLPKYDVLGIGTRQEGAVVDKRNIIDAERVIQSKLVCKNLDGTILGVTILG